MELRDYNGPGSWSADAIQERYLAHARTLGVEQPRSLRPSEHVAGDVRWVYPVMDEVIVGIKSGDPACVELGVEFVESGHRQPFGRILHANVARALRRSSLTPHQVERLRRRILGMLVAGDVPHEFHEYARLLRRIGPGDAWLRTRGAVDESNRYVMRYIRYLEGLPAPPGEGV
jgi:hypothetical protein